MCIVFIEQVWRLHKFKKAKVSFKRHIAVLSRAITCLIIVKAVHKTYEKVSLDESVILGPVSPFSDKCMALYENPNLPYTLYSAYTEFWV
jgi:hypothetical protein